MFRLTEKQLKQLQSGKPIGRTSKFLNQAGTADGYKFDSQLEVRYYRTLKLRAAAGEVKNIRVHILYPLVVNGHEICKYEADFVYDERLPAVKTLFGKRHGWKEVIADTKSEPTRRRRDYRIKKKLMSALGFEILEVLDPVKHRTSRRR